MIPDLMCALGFFPTQLEIENMITEIKYSKFSETGEVVERVHFEDFVKLYVNHRPVFAVGPKQVAAALEAMKKEEGPLLKQQLLSLLTKEGEKMTQEELEDCLLKLVGEPNVHKVLGDEIDGLDFAHNILGLADLEEVESQELSAEGPSLGPELSA